MKKMKKKMLQTKYVLWDQRGQLDDKEFSTEVIYSSFHQYSNYDSWDEKTQQAGTGEAWLNKEEAKTEIIKERQTKSV